MRRGYTLVEVVVAFLVLEIGLLGSLGLLTLATRTLERAQRVEAAVALVEGVADSLAAASGATGASRRLPDGDSVRWSVSADGSFTIEYDGADGRGVRVGVTGRSTSVLSRAR